jgi:hypothetical protein
MILWTVISRFTVLVLAGLVASVGWRFASLKLAGRRRRLNLLAIEVRLADSLERFHREVFKLKHYRVLRPNAGFFCSTNMSSLRYIRGRQYED